MFRKALLGRMCYIPVLSKSLELIQEYEFKMNQTFESNNQWDVDPSKEPERAFENTFNKVCTEQNEEKKQIKRSLHKTLTCRW